MFHVSYFVFSGLSRVMDIPGLYQNLGFLWFLGCFPFLRHSSTVFYVE
ncbi:MHC class I antigen ZJA transcript variant 3 [Acetobacter orientalis]|uniref:MHC class I antigen ZJA transcript variant 3 n=1 Tax=Acetobacter orientalis TaxID=146474 RepID=A0A2Z5ZGY9_9PROT|nr:MHC class I antigen ZJA transcript variant 3 [Acetobacter orientalis]